MAYSHDQLIKNLARATLRRVGFVTSGPPTQENDVNQEIQAWYENYQRNEQQQRAAARDEGLREGRDEGLREGERKLLLRLLRARFGELPAAVLARVEAAEGADLERWGERVLAADSLDAVFGDPT